MTEKSLEHYAIEEAFISLKNKLDWVESILDDKPIPDFALTHNVVKKVYDLKKTITDAELEKIPDFSKSHNGNSV